MGINRFKYRHFIKVYLLLHLHNCVKVKNTEWIIHILYEV